MTERRDGERQLFCRVITPEQVVFDGEADMVIARLAEGEIGVLAGHAPTVSTVPVGDVRINRNDEWEVFATSDGFFKVSGDLVQVLVEEAVPVGEIDVEEAEGRVEGAEREYQSVPENAAEAERQRQEAERQRRIGENLSRVARRYGGG